MTTHCNTCGAADPADLYHINDAPDAVPCDDEYHKQHQHAAAWTMGEHPIVARCRGCENVMVNGGKWVTPKQAEAMRREVGWRAAL